MGEVPPNDRDTRPVRGDQSYKNRPGFGALYECLFQVIYFKAVE